MKEDSPWLNHRGLSPWDEAPPVTPDVTPLWAFLMRVNQPRPRKQFTDGGNELLKRLFEIVVTRFRERCFTPPPCTYDTVKPS
jgi:hypothetical protein